MYIWSIHFNYCIISRGMTIPKVIYLFLDKNASPSQITVIEANVALNESAHMSLGTYEDMFKFESASRTVRE